MVPRDSRECARPFTFRRCSGWSQCRDQFVTANCARVKRWRCGVTECRLAGCRAGSRTSDPTCRTDVAEVVVTFFAAPQNRGDSLARGGGSTTRKSWIPERVAATRTCSILAGPILLPRHGVCHSPSPVECDDSRRTRNLARGEREKRATATEDKNEDSDFGVVRARPRSRHYPWRCPDGQCTEEDND